ncbi:hypothetical protein Atai01_15250 [Amycolatopsis taiwanensis]|uniref:Uncharacterized protein n=1 Tax=Amycolatopsis taiwanensis TaxID=342230 RepID=A0A9W6QY39_9PSEU|nr:hypothetical protein Atai01_15250 [Amycolatopsis taiwanensis]
MKASDTSKVATDAIVQDRKAAGPAAFAAVYGASSQPEPITLENVIREREAVPSPRRSRASSPGDTVADSEPGSRDVSVIPSTIDVTTSFR